MIKISIEEMSEYVDEPLLNALGDVCTKAQKTISCVEFTVAALLGVSIGESADSLEKIEIQLEAYITYIKALAENTFDQRMQVN